MTLFTNFLVLSTEAALCSCVTDFRVEDERMMPYYCTLVRGGQYFFFVCICWNLALEFYTSIIKIAIAFAFVSLFVSDIKCSYKKFSVWFTWGVVWASKRGEGAKIGLLIGINTHWMRFVRLLEQLPYPTTIVPEFHLFGIGHIFTPGFFFSPLSFFFASSSQNFKKRKKKRLSVFSGKGFCAVVVWLTQYLSEYLRWKRKNTTPHNTKLPLVQILG